jgi:hypothetical protein
MHTMAQRYTEGIDVQDSSTAAFRLDTFLFFTSPRRMEAGLLMTEADRYGGPTSDPNSPNGISGSTTVQPVSGPER